MNKKLLRTLERLKAFGTVEDHVGMYPGDWWDGAPRQYRELQRLGFVDEYLPHNPVHKTRAVITDEGLAFLSERRGDE